LVNWLENGHGGWEEKKAREVGYTLPAPRSGVAGFGMGKTRQPTQVNREVQGGDSKNSPEGRTVGEKRGWEEVRLDRGGGLAFPGGNWNCGERIL